MKCACWPAVFQSESYDLKMDHLTGCVVLGLAALNVRRVLYDAMIVHDQENVTIMMVWSFFY
jgi:hypothetical protein